MSELAPLAGKISSRPFLVLDIESKDGDSQAKGFTRPFMVGVYDGVEYTAFRDSAKARRMGKPMARYFHQGGCVDNAMSAILQRKYKGWNIYAHNAGKFDYLHILPWLMHAGDAAGFKFSLIPVSSSIQVMDIWRPYKDRDGKEQKWNRWRFLDSLRLIPTSLDKAAKTFGLAGKIEHDLDMHEDDPLWNEYNRQDCVQLHGVLSKFHHYIEKVLLGEVGITAPSTAMKVFRRRYLKAPVPRSEESHEFIRRGYVGGRVEAFISHGKNLRYFDINSSYPFSMLKPMPVGNATHWVGAPPERFLNHRIGFCDVEVTVPMMQIPPLPLRAGKLSKSLGVPDKLLFPCGRLRGVWEWDELQMALKVGCTINKWHESWWFGTGPFFEQFVRELYKYRDKSNPKYDPALSDIAKIMLNASYGKFGMRTLRKTIYRWDDPDLPDGAEPANKDVDALIWYAEEEVDAPYIMPQVAARVTALSRIRLYEAMQEALGLGGKVYYCDTDSVITDVVLQTGNELGALKDEFPEYSGHIQGSFLGPKLYLLEAPAPSPAVLDDKGMPMRELEKVKAKGVQTRTKDTFNALRDGEAILMKRLQKVGSMAQNDFQQGPQIISVPRRLLPAQSKRVDLVDSKGELTGMTRPHEILMW